MRNEILVLLCVLLLASPASAGETDDLANPDPSVRKAAIEKLRSAGEGAVPSLIEGIGSPNPLLAVTCLDLAAEGGLRATRSATRKLVENAGTKVMVRRAAIRALGLVGDYRDISLLSGLLTDWPDAALALVDIGDSDALAALRERLAAGNVTPELGRALAFFGDDRGVTALVEMLDGPRGEAALRYLRAHAKADPGRTREAWLGWHRLDRLASGLENPDWAASEAYLAGRLATDDPDERGALAADLLAIATDRTRSRAARTNAVSGLGRLKDPATAPRIVRLLFTDPDGMVRVYCAEALGRIGAMATAVDLVWYLVNDEEEFRKISAKHRTDPYYTIDSEVVKALLRLGAPGALDKMIAQLGAEHRVRVYHQAVRALQDATGQDFGYEPDARRADRILAATRWRHWFDEHREEIPRAKVAGLSDPEFRRRVRELVEGLGNFHFLEMSRARQKLTLLGELVVPELIAGLEDPAIHIRTHCAEVLGWIRARSARAALAKALSDPRVEVRTAAANALALMGPGLATDMLIRVLSGTDTEEMDVRIEAARALARAPAGVAVTALVNALSRKVNDSDTFRIEAWFALAAHGDPKYVDELLSLMAKRPEIALRQVMAARVAALTGRDPGVTDESISAFRKEWEASRERYTPEHPFGEER